MAAPLLDALREATAAAHAATERVPSLARLLSPDLTRVEYAATLAGLFGFHAAVEPAIARAVAPLPAAAALIDEARLAALAADLALLGVSPPPAAPAAAMPALGDWAAGLGGLYVIAGSALGGRVIAKQVEQRLGLSPAGGTAFFDGGGAAAVRDGWHGLVAVLEAAPIDPATEARILAAASDCFDRLGAWMARV